jgi:Respiratory-chain NADH dehydrogenase, 49 Kd subunit
VGLSETLGRFAADGPVPVFAIAGLGAREAIQDLRLRSELRVLDTPRPASVLLIAGTIPDAFALPIARIHDAMAHPRATILWTGDGEWRPALPGAAQPAIVGADPVAAAVVTYRDLVTGRRPSEPPILPDVDPVAWRGVGPYGQGGSGMTGGTPYGRPLAELAPDPDGLRLDVLPIAIGPFFPRFPAGLVLDVRFSGDLVLDATVGEPDFGDGDLPVRAGLRPFLRALSEPVSIAELELARARDHLRWLSDALIASGLNALGLRALRLASSTSPGDGTAVRRLARALGWTQIGRWSTRGVGRISRDELAGLGAGPVARAAGLAEDVRLDDPAYRELGFEPIIGDGSDAAARLRLRLAEAAQSFELAARAGDRRTTPRGRVESPRGRLEAGSGPSARLLPLVPGAVRETEWGDAVTTLVSLDIDLEEAILADPAMPAAAVA